MNFDLSPEQKLLKEQARRFLAAECPSARVRQTIAGGHDAALWRAVAEQGWLGANIPEQYGGLGLGPIETCVIAEEMGRALAPLPFATTVYLFAELVARAGREEQRQEWLPQVAAGALIGCLATSEGPGAETTSTTRVAGGRLHGAKLPVLDGGVADIAIVSAVEDGEAALFAVRLDDEGVAREPVKTLDPTRTAAILRFDGAPAERLAGNAPDLLADVRRRAAIFLAFEQLGGADACLEIARDHAVSRHAFGAPIGRYQAIKHKLADVYVGNELARSNAYYAAWALEADAPELAAAAAAARIAASEAYWQASKENIQTHGGLGFTWEMDCHLYYRRAQLLALMVGAPAEWKRRLYAALAAAA